MRNEDLFHEAQCNSGRADEAYIARQKEELEWEEMREKEEEEEEEEEDPCEGCTYGRCRHCDVWWSSNEDNYDKSEL